MKQYKILVIGSGGTGGYFLKEATRYIAHLPSEKKNMICDLLIADGDILENKNLSRQSFSKSDVGRYKSSSMADLLNTLFEDAKQKMMWRAYTKYIVTMEDLTTMLKTDIENVDEFIPVIIGCVDNHACRLLCERFFHEVSSCIYFDSANEFSAGQVVFSYKWRGVEYSPCRSSYFPGIQYGDLRSVTDIPCTELNEVAPQHIVTNMLAGNHLLAALCKLLESSEMLYGMTLFNAHTMQSEFVPYHSSFEERLSKIQQDLDMEALRLSSMDHRFYTENEIKSEYSKLISEEIFLISTKLSELKELLNTDKE